MAINLIQPKSNVAKYMNMALELDLVWQIKVGVSTWWNAVFKDTMLDETTCL